MQQTPDPSFWAGRRVLVTGHTGFKGAWLTCWLRNLGAHVHGVSLPGRHGEPCLWDQLALEGVGETRADVSTDVWFDDARRFSPDIVLHLAAQSLVSEGFRDPLVTFRTNVMGTAQVMSFLRQLREARAAVIVTTDKVYDTRQATPFREEHFLGGIDPYSASKAGAELVTHSWPGDTARVVTARAGNVIGGGDWSLNRLVPDMVRAWSEGNVLMLRRPSAIRPWQHVVEPLAGYLVYAEAVAGGGQVPRSLNFGPAQSQTVPVLDLVGVAAQEWQRLSGGARPGWEVEETPGMVETHDLTLDPSLAHSSLGWSGRWSWHEAIRRSLEWYVAAAEGHDPAALMTAQIKAYSG